MHTFYAHTKNHNHITITLICQLCLELLGVHISQFLFKRQVIFEVTLLNYLYSYIQIFEFILAAYPKLMCKVYMILSYETYLTISFIRIKNTLSINKSITITDLIIKIFLLWYITNRNTRFCFIYNFVQAQPNPCLIMC